MMCTRLVVDGHPLLALVLLVLLAGRESAPAAEADRLTLPAVIAEALEKNPEIQALQRRFEAARARVPQARALPDPTIAIAPETAIGGRLGTIEYTLAQQLPFPGKLRLRGEVAQAEANQAQAEYQAKRLEVVTKVKSAYYQLFLAHRALEIKRQEADLLKQFARIARAKYTVGTAAQQDALKAQVILATTLNQLITLEQEKEVAAAALNTLLNRPPQAPLGTPGPVELTPFPYTLEQLQQIAVANRAELQAARYAIERSEAAHALARRQYYPDFSVGLEYDQVRRGLDKWQPVVQINIPWLFTKPKYEAQVREAEARIGASKASLEALRNRTLFEVSDLLTKLQTAERQATLYQTSVLPLAEQTLHAATIGYQTGKVDFLTLLESQRTLRDVELGLYQGLVAMQQRRAELELALGMELP
jgi:cobalt-zinc-cadmium efflux system outer membrane protein